MINLIKRQYPILLVFAVAILVQTACSPAPQAPPAVTATPLPTNTPPPEAGADASQDVWSRIQANGTMMVGTSADYPPFESYNGNFQIDGFDAALIREIGQSLGVDVELRDMAFEGLPGALQLGHIDVAIAAISVTPEREASMDFSQIYFVGEDAILAPADSSVNAIRSVEELAPYTVGVQVASVYSDWLYDNLVTPGLMPPANLFVYADADQAVRDLADGRVQLVVVDLLPAQQAVQAGGVKLVGQGLNKQRLAIALPKGATTLQAEINQALTELQNSGRVAALVETYLNLGQEDLMPVPPPTPLPPPPTQAPQPPTPTPVPAIDGMAWVQDLNYDDQNMTAPPQMSPGQPFSKGWRILNNGTTTWDGSYTLSYVQGNSPAASMGGQPVVIQGQVPPGQSYDIYANLVAPTTPGVYQGFWQMRNGQGTPFGARVWVGISVPGAPTPPPAPTQTPSPNINFNADRTNIRAGECVNFSWNVSNVREVYFYAQGERWEDHGVTGQETRTQCPPQTTTYYLRVVETDGSVKTPEITIYVEPVGGAPLIARFTVNPGGTVVLGQCVLVEWDVQGNVNRVKITRDDVSWDGAPFRGNFQDCPDRPGVITYLLEAFGPGGTSQAVQQLTVVEAPQQATPTPLPATPAPEPPRIDQFTLSAEGQTDVQEIFAGTCVTISWAYSGRDLAQAALLRNEDTLVFDPPMSGSQQDCPPAPGDYVYRLKVDSEFGESASAQRTLRVVGPTPR